MITIRAEWPHTIDDIVKSLEGVWGVVGAKGINGNLYRIERSLKEPITYTVIQYEGESEVDIVTRSEFQREQRDEAVNMFAKA
ncbi:MAG: hypothetical protein K2Z81_14555, partial [Cyanobacteria bacterium]|nr:hypothetical protein [Cyanobacteriota bacterium]